MGKNDRKISEKNKNNAKSISTIWKYIHFQLFLFHFSRGWHRIGKDASFMEINNNKRNNKNAFVGQCSTLFVVYYYHHLFPLIFFLFLFAFEIN